MATEVKKATTGELAAKIFGGEFKHGYVSCGQGVYVAKKKPVNGQAAVFAYQCESKNRKVAGSKTKVFEGKDLNLGIGRVVKVGDNWTGLTEAQLKQAKKSFDETGK